MIFNYILDYICSKFNQLLSSWNQDIIQPNKLAKLRWVCWWIVFRIFHPKINQNIVYNSQKRAHGIKFWLYLMDSLVTLVPPLWVNRTIVQCHTSLGCSWIYRDQYWHNNQPICIYGHPTYPSLFHLQAPFSRQNLMPNPVNYNKAMSQTPVPVEWLFNEIETYFKLVS